MSKLIEFYGPQQFISPRKKLLIHPQIQNSKIIIYDENNNEIIYNNLHKNYFRLYNDAYQSNSNEICGNTLETNTNLEFIVKFGKISLNKHRIILKNNKLIFDCNNLDIVVKNDVGLVIKETLYKNAIFEYTIDESYISKLERFLIKI